MSELGQLLDDFKRQRENELTAVTAQTAALQGTLKDTTNQVAKAQKQLIALNAQCDSAQQQAAAVLRDAQQRAAVIVGEADKTNAEAEAVLKQAQDQAKEIVAKASAAAVKIDHDIANKRAELQALQNQIGAKRTALDVLKKNAKDFAES